MKTSLLFNHRIVLSLEVLPPKKIIPVSTIYNTLGEFKGITPDFVSVTYGVGDGENSQTALKVASAIKHRYGIESVAHIPCLNLTKEDVLSILEQLKEQKIENILVLRGDRVSDRGSAGDFRYASDLMGSIKLHGDLNIIGAYYPESHQESGSLVRDMKHLRDEVNAGVSQLITQFFFNNGYFYHSRERMDLMGIHVPAEAGIMPVVNKK